MKNRFNSFTDNGQKITPALASDWIFNDSDRSDYLRFSSSSLSQSFTVYLGDFIAFTKRLNITMVGNKLQGSFIFDKDRDLQSEQEYYEWEDQLEMNAQNEIKKADLVAGEAYKDDSGHTVIYLGSKYVSKIKGSYYNIKNSTINEKVGSISKKHLFIYKRDLNQNYSWSSQIKDSYKGKIIEVSPKNSITDEKLVKLQRSYYEKDQRIAFCDDYKAMNPIYEVNSSTRAVIKE